MYQYDIDKPRIIETGHLKLKDKRINKLRVVKTRLSNK